MKKKKTTNQLIEDLAISVQNGFIEVKEKMESGFKEVRQEIKELDQKVDKRFDKIESFVNGHERRFERLEDDMRVVKTKVGIGIR